MSQGRSEDPPRPGADLVSLARDWVTICQSEFSALATDREAQEGWPGLLALWAGAAGAALAAAPRGFPDATDRRTGPDASAGASSTDAASDSRDAAIERLSRRLAELEQRLAELERDSKLEREGERSRIGEHGVRCEP